MTTEPHPVPGAVDTHAHVFVRGLPLTSGRRYSPDYDATPDTYLKLLDAHGMDAGVLVQPSFLGTDNSYLLDALALAPYRLRGVAVVEPEVAEAEVDRLAEAGVCGIRLNLIGRAVPELGDTVWQRLGRLLAARDLHLEIQARREQWDDLTPRLLRWPGAVVVDHLGLPADPALSHPGAAALARLLSAEHVWVKASAPYRSAPHSAAAMLHRILDTAGPDRLVWGSDWPWTRHEPGRAYSALLTWLTTRLDTSDKEKVLSANPRRLFRLPTSSRATGR